MSQPHYDELVRLATEAGFPESDFTEAEKKLFGSLANGHKVDCKEDPEKQRTVRAEIFEWVLTDREAAKHHQHRGVSLADAIFPDGFDLTAVMIAVPLVLERCDFLRGLLLENADLPRLSLSACRVNRGDRDHAINADEVRIGSSLNFDEAFKADGEVCLVGASIAGELSMRGAELTNPDGNAFSADGAKIDGGVFLDEKFKAEGEVRLLGALIGGDLVMRNAELTNPSEDAFSAERAKIDGDVFFDQGFKANGKVGFQGASISGSLDMHGAKLTVGGGNALTIESTNIGQRADFSDAEVKGTVNLFAARIAKHLNFDGASIAPIDSDDDAIYLSEAAIGGGLYFFSGAQDNDTASQAKVQGRINLRNAKVGTLRDWPTLNAAGSSAAQLRDAPVIALDGFTYDRIGRHSPVDAAFRKEWLALGKGASGGFAPQPYTQLAKVLRDMGHPREATTILVEREKRQLKEGGYPKWERRLRRYTIGCFIGYGYRPWHALAPLVALLVIGTHVFMVGWSHGHFNPVSARVYTAQRSGATASDWRLFPTDAEDRYKYLSNQPDDPKHPGRLPEYPAFQSFVYSLDTLVPIVDLHQENYWMPAGRFRVYLWFHIALGWIFTTLLLAGLAGVVRRPAE